MKQAKLNIDLMSGIVSVSGPSSLVERIYDDLSDSIVKHMSAKDLSAVSVRKGFPAAGTAEQSVEKKPVKSPTRRTRQKQKNNGDAAASKEGMSTHQPQLVNDLNLDELSDFVEAHQPKNHSENILVFLHFLSEKLGKTPATVDDIFTCYEVLQKPMPKAFGQSFIDTRNKHKTIDFESWDDVSVTIVGRNRLLEMRKKG